MRSALLVIGFTYACLLGSLSQAENWPGWRGPRGDGTSVENGVPTSWDGSKGDNINWKVAIPGVGHSSPIVWDDRVFLVTCDEDTTERLLICLDRSTGQVMWKQNVVRAPLERKHKLNSFASGTPATDGKMVFVTFLVAEDFSNPDNRTPGKMIVAAYDFSGKQQWQVTPGSFASRHGFCSSPVLFKDKVIINGDHDGDSYIVALEQTTGKTLWKVSRKHKTRSYVTPIIREIDGKTQMVLSGSKSITSYDPNDGSLHWEIDGPTEQFVASMVYDGKLMYMTAGFPTYHVMGIDPDGKGNITETNVAWHVTDAHCYVPSPVVVGRYLFIADDRGTANCYLAASGERAWRDRLGNHFSASLVTAGGLVYFTADDGTTTVVRPGKELDVVAANPLGEFCYASPAISDGQLFLRGEKHLFCVGTRKVGAE